MDKIQEYWDNQALEFGTSSLATTPDGFSFKMEIDVILKYLKPGLVCDIGCGNAQKVRAILERVKCDYLGVDYSKEMIKIAQLEKQKLLEKRADLKLNFKQGDILDTNLLEHNFYDTIITDRCLINLSNFELQKIALKNIYNFLKPGARYICIENFLEPLENLNSIRAKFNLEPIKMRWHNCYFKQDEFLNFCQDFFELEKEDNFASSYYLISRTLNAVLNKADYNSKLNELSMILPPLGDFSAQKCFVFKKPSL